MSNLRYGWCWRGERGERGLEASGRVSVSPYGLGFNRVTLKLVSKTNNK